MGSVFGDYDNDGFEDLLLYRWGRPELFHNDGGRRLHARHRQRRSLPRGRNINAAVWLDFDRDGRLDIFLGGLFLRAPESLEARRHAGSCPRASSTRTTAGASTSIAISAAAASRRSAQQVGLVSRRWALAAVAADLRGTGYPDLFIANDYGVSELFVNEGGRFREVGRETGVGYAPKSGMNASVGDVLNQGKLAIYVSNISEEGILLQGNNLWVADRTAERRLPRLREHGAGDGHRPRRLELRRAVRRPEQRRLPRSVPGERLRICRPRRELLVRLLEGRRRPPGRDRRCRELAGDGSPQPRRLPAEAGLDQRRLGPIRRRRARWSASPTGTMAVPSRSPISTAAARSTSSSPTSEGPLLLYRNEVAAGRHWIAFELEGGCRGDADPDGAATAAPSAPRSRSSGAAAAGPGGLGRIGILRAEPAAASLRPGRDHGGRAGGDPLAVRDDPGTDGPGRRAASPDSGAGMTERVTGPPRQQLPRPQLRRA